MTTQLTQLIRHRFTVHDYHKMAESGILGPDSRVELIDGEVVEMAAIGPGHASSVDRITLVFFQRFSEVAQVRIQGPIRLDEYSEPQPDVSLLRRRPDYYTKGHPLPADVLLVVEVGDATARLDRHVKLPLYGRHAISELWLIDLVEKTLTICREPHARGYRAMTVLHRGDRVAPLAFPDREIAVTDILGDASPA